MEFAWIDIISKWAKQMGFGPAQTMIIVVGVGVLIYLGRIFQGIKAGYGVILQDQKDATEALRMQIKTEREERQALFDELDEVRSQQVKLVTALSKAKLSLAANGIPVPVEVIQVVQEVLGEDK